LEDGGCRIKEMYISPHNRCRRKDGKLKDLHVHSTVCFEDGKGATRIDIADMLGLDLSVNERFVEPLKQGAKEHGYKNILSYLIKCQYLSL
jgi:hypothetical protein